MTTIIWEERFDHTAAGVEIHERPTQIWECDPPEHPDYVNIYYMTSPLQGYENKHILNSFSRNTLISQIHARASQSDRWTQDLMEFCVCMNITTSNLRPADYILTCKLQGGSLAYDIEQAKRQLVALGDVELPIIDSETSARDQNLLIHHFSHYWCRLLIVLGTNQAQKLVSTLLYRRVRKSIHEI